MNVHHEFMKFIFGKCDQYGISRTELSKRLGVNKGHVSRYDRPMNKGLGINSAYDICAAAETTFIEFAVHLLVLKTPRKVIEKVDKKKKAE